MKYIIAIDDNLNHTEYVAEGNNYIVNGAIYVPLTGSASEARRYKTRKIAERASERNGENMWGRVRIIEVEE
ncbi:MAG: hypothetical protein K6B67_05665 [Lachnospiraceae bacterium]|nr:hypothetical protein [Lachnospiraceae bacterium]